MDEYPSAAPTVTIREAQPIDQQDVAAPGTQIGRYVVVGHLGAGGMGSVYAAFDTQLARRVAIKVLRPDARGTGGHARLQREAQAMARLTHPNVVAVHDVGTYGDDVFLAMEYIEGRTLKAWMRDAHSWQEALAILKAAGRGLAAAHAAGLVHRDFKPENVLVGNDGRVVVADFGIARAHGEPLLADSLPPPSSGPKSGDAPPPPSAPVPSSSRTPPTALETPLTETGAWIGTVGYMAPERAFDFRDDARSDQFSFAVTLYRVLYGKPPFVYSSVSTYLTALLEPPLPPPADTRVPAWVHAVIARGLQHEPAQRYASMDEMLAALDRDPSRRRRAWLGVGVALAIAGAGAAGFVRHRGMVRAECAAGERIIAETWSPSVRDAVGAAIVATGAPLADATAVRAQRVLDDWAQGWAGAYREAEEATRVRGVESTATLGVRLACLERERGAMGALVDRLVHADKGTAHRALTAAYQLPQPKACWEPNAARADALPDDPARRARVLALQKQIAVAAALRSTGGCKGVVEATDRGLDEARAIPHRESEAVLLSIRAGCERQAGDVERAIASREESFAAAVAAGDDEQAAVVAAKIAFDLSSGLGKVREAERWLAIGHGALEREGQDDRAQAELLNSEVEIVSGEGYPERAIPLHERAIALLTAVYGPDHPAVAAAINNYATDLSSVGRLEESIAQLRKSAAIDESVFGPDDPMLHYDYNNIGVGYTLLGHYDDARVAIERSLALVASLGPMNANAVVPWASLAVLDNRDGRPDAALGDVDHAMQIVKATGDNGARFLPCLYEERGTALLVKGDAAGAIDACSRALKLQEEQGVIAADKLYTDDALTCLGQAELAAGRVHDAVGHLERGATLKKRDWKAALPIAEIALAKALRAEGKDLERAQKLADDGLAGLRGLDGVERQVRDAEGWVAAGGRK